MNYDFKTRDLESMASYVHGSRKVASDSLLENARILMVDQNVRVLDHLEQSLREYGIEQLQSCFDPEEAAHLLSSQIPDIVLLEPVFGLELLRTMRPVASLQSVGVIFTSDDIQPADKLEAMQLGASAFLRRPIDPRELVISIRNIVASKAYHDHLSYESSRLEGEIRQQIFELEDARSIAEEARQRALECLTRAAEFRDDDTSQHVLRVGRYVVAIAKRFDISPEHLEMLEQAAQLHDVGKIGVSDSILLKPGELTEEEFDAMRKHCEYGSNIIFPMSDNDWEILLNDYAFETVSQSSAPIMQLGALIARTHHEKWDGTGYPYGLKGEQIPLVGRITAIADVFDALSSERPYKEAFPISECFRIIRLGRGNHFDPAVVDAFFDAKDEIIAIRKQLDDHIE